MKRCYLFALLSGGLLPFAFAPYQFYGLAVLCPAILLRLLEKANPKVIGFCFGLGFFGVGTSWVYISIHRYGNTAPWLAVIITALLVSYLASFFLFQGWLFSQKIHFPKVLFRLSATQRAFLLFPTGWVASEWLRAHLLGGVPWLLPRT